ncbi:choice-of-anchor I family protein [Psychrobacillus sp. INOP01]|uniref:choice-of-anchor I family protein n=1 Tax=Psychrobacillus sp. INOP01 TaxID=2829187 RepID=UPI001BAE0608|nr:choice-of-anchor I family protein [Psychrobacillus sp. INOP01]QUG40562.1 choice-of-anchor I family protein [Psychrobacillus sp. INOP01]
MKKHASSYQKKLFGATLATVVATGTITTAVPVHTQAEEVVAPSFSDVKNIESNYFYESVISLASRGIVKGFGDGTFKPYQSVTRGQMASVIAKTLEMNIENVKNPGFKDVKVTDEYYGPIAALVEAGIIDGYNDKTFKPGKPLTRAQMSKIISLAFKLEEVKLTNTPFTDVKAEHWYADYVQALIANEVTTGTTPTTFEPNAYVTRGQMASFIVRSESPVQKTAKLIGVTNESVELSSGTYALSADLKKIMNASNSAALLGSVLEYTVKDGVIVGIDSIELTANGNEANNIVLDGQGTKFAGTVRVNGDYVSLKNLTIEKDLEIGKEVENSFKAFDIKVLGRTNLTDKTSISRDNKVFSAAAVEVKEPSFVFTDSTIQSVEVSKGNKVIIEVKGNSTAQEFTLLSNVHLKADKGITLPKVNMKKGATNVTLDASVDNLSVDTPNTMSIDGTANIKNVTVKTKIDLKLRTTGKIEKLIVDVKGTAITLGAGTKVDKFELPEGTTAKDIIVNFDELNSGSGGTSNGGNNSGNNGGNNGGGTDKNFQLTLMHTNDTHAKVETAPKRITAIKNERAQNPSAVLVDAGDVFSGTLYFNQYKGLADLAFMNLAEYDVMTFGNHEFDLGSSEEGHKALADFIKGAHFPFVSANADFSKDENLQGLFSDLVSSTPENGKIYNGIVKEVDGQKVGFFGLTTEETKGLSSPGQVTFTDYIVEAEKAVKAFEDMGVNKIVAISHIGYDDNPAVDNDLTLAAQVDGIDVIIGGHSHTKLATPKVIDKDETGATKDKTIIVQASSQGDFLGTLDVEFDKNGKVVGQAGKLIEVKGLEEDPEAKTLLETYKPAVDEIAEEEIGVSAKVVLENPRTNGDNTKPSVRKNETILGNLITDGMLAKAKSLNQEVIMAFQNGGGIRESIDVGPITVGEVITVLPFGNTLSTMEITGAQLKEAFETSVGVYPLENGGFLHVAGAKVEFDSSKPKGERVVSISYENADGSYTGIVDTETYTIATNYFTAQGGDNYDVFKEIYEAGKVKDLGLSDWENFADHLKTLTTIPTEIKGRIVDVAGQVVGPDPITGFYNTNPGRLAVSQIARYDSGQGEGGTEIMAYDAEKELAFVTNGAAGGFNILSFADLQSEQLTEVESSKQILLSEYGVEGVDDITSIASHPTEDLIAISAVSNPKTDNGHIVFATKSGVFVQAVEVGALPDMVTFTPDGTKAIVANEGEPNDDYSVDPEGSISIIDLATFTVDTLTFTEEMLDEHVRVSSKGTILEQLEPEYVTVSADSKTAYVSLQENNAVATVDLVTNKILDVKGLGVKDHSVEGNELDALKDGAVKLEKQPILSFYMPDAIDTFTVADQTYIVTPNEGDARDYGAYSEEKKLSKIGKEVKLNAENYAGYTQEELDAFDLTKLADYKVTIENGLSEDKTVYEALYGYGGRSFSIFNADTMELAFDSGSDFESIIANDPRLKQYFNVSNNNVEVDDRSNSKGPEPESVVTGEMNGKNYAFIALERISGIMVYDLTNPSSPEFVTFITSRDFSQDIAGDVAPEGLRFIPASESPTGNALLAVTHEMSGTVAVYEFEGTAIPVTPVPAEDFSGKTHEGNISVDVSEVTTLENATVNGDLILTGTNSGTLTLTNVTITGDVDFTGVDGDIKIEGLDAKDGNVVL